MHSAARAVITAALLFITSAIYAQDRPVIGISASSPASVGTNYVNAVRKAGGVPMIIAMTGDEAELAKVLENHENSLIAIDNDNNEISIGTGKLDLGALGKGTGCDEAIKLLKSQKVKNALVTVGGTVGVIGSPDGKSEFGIGVRNPFGNKNDYFAILDVTDCFISTSGDYEKYFEKDGVRYSHIFDATTGKPVQNDLSSVTVVAENGMLSDFLSTVIYIEGVEKGVKIAEDFDASVIIVKKDKTVLVSEKLQDKFTLKDSSFFFFVIE